MIYLCLFLLSVGYTHQTNFGVQFYLMANIKKILVVDDNQSYLELLSDYLNDENYDVVCCFDGKDAQEKFTEFLPDLVLTDIVMPEVDGIELLLALRKINPSIHVIAMSGGNKGFSDSYLQMAEKLGANVILNKPFDLSLLLKEIKKLDLANKTY